MTPELVKNLLIAFEALSMGKTLDDGYMLLADLGFQKDKLILVGHSGITTLEKVCKEPPWDKQMASDVLVKFRGGPETCIKRMFTATVRAYIIDRLIVSVELYGLEHTLEAVRTIWGINVKASSELSTARN